MDVDSHWFLKIVDSFEQIQGIRISETKKLLRLHIHSSIYKL